MIYWCYIETFITQNTKNLRNVIYVFVMNMFQFCFQIFFFKKAMSHSILFVCLSLIYKILIEFSKTYIIYSSKTLVNFAIFILEILLYIFFKRWRIFQFHLLLYIFLSVLAIFFHQILHQQPQLYYLQIV